MKILLKLIIFLFPIIFIQSCKSSTKKFQKAIEEYEFKNGTSFSSYKSKELLILDTITIGESKKYMYDYFHCDEIGIEDERVNLKKKVDNSNNYYDRLEYFFPKYELERINKLQNQKEGSVDYYVVKNRIDIITPLVNMDTITLTKAYLISGDFIVLTYLENGISATNKKDSMYQCENLLFKQYYKDAIGPKKE